MQNISQTLTSDLAIILYESLGLLVSVILCFYFSKRMKKIQEMRERGERKKKYSDLENSLKNDKRR